MLIFHGFPDPEHADAFAIAVRDTFGRSSRVCKSQEESDKYDPFPFQLRPPIVLVTRGENWNSEPQIEELAVEFCGEFAGT